MKDTDKRLLKTEMFLHCTWPLKQHAIPQLGNASQTLSRTPLIHLHAHTHANTHARSFNSPIPAQKIVLFSFSVPGIPEPSMQQQIPPETGISSLSFIGCCEPISERYCPSKAAGSQWQGGTVPHRLSRANHKEVLWDRGKGAETEERD